MTWKAAVTYESPNTASPDTVRVEVEAGSPSTACARAIRLASKARKGKRFESISVLLEKAGKGGNDVEDDA